MSTSDWLEVALSAVHLTPVQRLILIELKRLAAGGAGEANVQDVAATLGMHRQTVFEGVLRLQHVGAIDLVLRDTRVATAWFDFGPSERRAA